MKYDYEIVFIPQDGGGYTVEVPDLPGCITESETIEEGKILAKESIELYLETMLERGIPLPRKHGNQIIKTVIQISYSEKSIDKSKQYAKAA